jgi:acyl carrier protein
MTKIEQLVLSTLEDLTGRKLREGDLDSDLTKDLKITSDDLSFVFVPNLEKSLGIRVPTRAWDHIHCGRDTARLLEKLTSADVKE